MLCTFKCVATNFQAEYRTMAAFVLTAIMNDYRPGQVS